MSEPLFIAISGKKGSGKDTLAQLLMSNLSEHPHFLSVEITHFADPLKEICIQLFGLDKKNVYGSNADKEKLTGVAWDGFPLEVRIKYSNQVVMIGNSVQDHYAWGEHEERVPRTGPMTHRELLQVMGSDIFRERVYNNVWAEHPFKQKWVWQRPYSPSRYEAGPMDVVIIADCRFPNEIEETIKNGGHVIRVKRDTGFNDNHPSETALDNYNWNQANHIVVNNNLSLAELHTTAQFLAKIIGELIGGK